MTTQENNVAEARVDPTRGRSLRRNQEENNPCYKRNKYIFVRGDGEKKISAENVAEKAEHLLSLKCLDSNPEDRTACEMYFVNYKSCRDFWTSVQHKRKLKGIKPYLPPPEERAKIKADFLNSR